MLDFRHRKGWMDQAASNQQSELFSTITEQKKINLIISKIGFSRLL